MFEKNYIQLFELLYAEYDKLLLNAFESGSWSPGQKYSNNKIKWTDAYQARIELEAFGKTGIYIWGTKNKPLYIGKAEKQSFKKRFNRYVFGKNSQCSIGLEYQNLQITVGEMNQLGLSNSRIQGAIAFAEAGMETIWFILIPISQDKISALEAILIEVGEHWNRKKYEAGLINLDKSSF